MFQIIYPVKYIKMAGNSAWNQAVKTAFKMGRKTSKTYSLKQAMFDAQKIYKKGKSVVASIGSQTRRGSKKGYRRRTHKGGNPTKAPMSVGGNSTKAPMSVGGTPTKTPMSIGGNHPTKAPMVVGGALPALSPSEVK